MPTIHSSSNNMCGQTLILAVVLLGLCSIMMLGLFQVSLVAREKIRLQVSADMAVLSVLNYQANSLNSLAIANRAILANDALAGQINAIISETTFYRKLADKFQKLLRLIPYVGVINRFLAAGIHALEKTTRGIASFTLPLIHYSNIALKQGQNVILNVLPVNSLEVAKSTLSKNMPQAKLTLPSEALVLHQARSLLKSIVKTEAGTTNQIKIKTMDRHTLKRNWKIRIAGISPVKKTGGTVISQNALIAKDKLRMKVFKKLRWKWKTVLTARSRTSDFGYLTPRDFISIDTRNVKSPLSLPILVQTEMPSLIVKHPFRERKIFALAAGRLIYRRDNKRSETPNLFNPFWKAQLIPVASEPTSSRIIPEQILKEVRH